MKYLFLALLIIPGYLIHAQPAKLNPNNTTISFEEVTDGLQNPWGMAFLPNGDVLITEKSGDIRIIRDGQLIDQRIEGVPDVYVRGQGGLMDIELHPEFGSNQFLYLTYSSTEGPGNGGNTTLARFKLQGNNLTDKKILYKGVPNTTKGAHFGSRIAFDDQGFIYFSIGDRHNRDINPQDINRDGGKIYRLHDDGRIPDDNPFVASDKAKKAIYSYGHRNPQGMAKNPKTGKIWAHEHGPRGGDEVNVIHPGKNYGWPIISYGINYNGTEFAEATSRPGMEQPISYWVPSIAPCGMTFVNGDKYPGWDGDLIVGSLKFGYLVHCTVEGDQITGQEIIAEGIGRVRNVEQGPDGHLYVGVEGKGLYRLTVK